MKKLLTLLLVVFVAGSVSAQSLKFGHINTTELSMVMPERDTILKKLDAFAKDIQEIYEGMQVEFNKKVDEFEKNQATWSETVKNAKQKEIIEFQRRLQERQESFREDLAREQEKLVTPMQERIRAAITKVGKDQGMIYVFDLANGAVVYFNPSQSVDIMPLVKKELKIK